MVAITAVTTLPWTIIAVWDAIDRKYRTRLQVGRRLLLSSACILIAYVAGIFFVIVLITQGDAIDGRHDEIATVLVLLVFNLWHVARNVRGWAQFFAIRKVCPLFIRMQTNFANTVPVTGAFRRAKRRKGICVQGMEKLRISERLFDNEINADAPYLSPFISLKAVSERRDEEEAWAIAMWRAWWTQDVTLYDGQRRCLQPPDSFKCEKENLICLAVDLLETEPSWPANIPQKWCDEGINCPLHDGDGNHEPHMIGEHGCNLGGSSENSGSSSSSADTVRDDSGRPILDKRRWAECLITYGRVGSEPAQGQQDTHGEALRPVFDVSDSSGIAMLIREKTQHPPNRMCALWYATARFEEVYEAKTAELCEMSEYEHILFPTWASWLKIAQDVGAHLERPVYLSDDCLVNFAGELASASLILVCYAEKFTLLVDQIHKDGLNARWTFGWSGLLSCFSHLWTKERIYVAMLNGLSLLAMISTSDVRLIDPNIRAMLYGYAAFAVSGRAVGRRIADDRNAELRKRYRFNKGKTCRGSGLNATRIACRELGLPAEASHMDGLPAFSTGWAREYMETKPGNQDPENGKTHDEVETREGSSNVWRFPHSVT